MAVNHLAEPSMLADVTTAALNGGAPFCCEAVGGEVNFFDWMHSHGQSVEGQLRHHGAVLFRGFDLAQQPVFERALQLLCRHVISGYGDLPPENGTDRVYKSTPYPANRSIEFHNESAHMPSWPTRQLFACVVAPTKGGETPLVDCRKIYGRLQPDVRNRFATRGLLYVRRFLEGVDVPWQAFFKTESRAAAEAKCRERGAMHAWQDDVLVVSQRSQAIARNPTTGEISFFNQIMLHHPYFLTAGDREALETIFGTGNTPRSVTYGDGTPIEEAILRDIHALYREQATSFSWRRGDLLLLDNMSVAHGRASFEGARKIIVGLGDPIEIYR
jgi:alpha-ketoglutarate-dependent taurine dioxygenase